MRPRPPPGRGDDPERHGQVTREEPKPRPIGDKCNPLCPFFRCSKNALRITTVYYRGRPMKVAMCAWIGDKCIGAQCRYASCAKHAMLPDGRCQFAVEASAKAKARALKDFEEELRELEAKAKSRKEFDEFI